MKEADRLPQHVVDGAIREAHQDDCPECGGAGPVDVHNSHTVWSAFVLTSWKNTPNLCCKSCGRNHQLMGLVSSFFLGWWGFPWGIIYTPIQIVRNLMGVLGGPNPYTPSEQFETIMRLDLAGRSLAGEPLPDFGRRPERSRSAVAKSADDRIPGECDHCGKKFKAKGSLAGKAMKCRGCGSRVIVPDVEDYESLEDEYEEEWDDGGNDDNWYGRSEDSAGTSRSRRGSSKKGRRSKKKSNTWRTVGLVVLCLFVGKFILITLGIIIAIFVHANRAPAPVVQRNPAPIQVPGRPNFDPPNFPSGAAVSPDTSQVGNPTQAAAPPNSVAGSQSAAAQTENAAASPFQPVAEMPTVNPLPNVNRAGRVWFVLSNLREGQKTSSSMFDKPFLLDYQLASGAPSSSDSYVLHLSATRGRTFKQHATVKFPMQDNGTIKFKLPPQLASADKFTAAIALPAGTQQLDDVSEEISPGDSPTAAVAPPSVVELAGAGARGKTLAIANPEYRNDDGPFSSLKLKFVLQQEIPGASYHLLVATPPSGPPLEFDLSHMLWRAVVGRETEYSGRLVGPSAALKPPFKLHVVRRKSRFPSRVQAEAPAIVSNTVHVTE